MNCTNCGTPLIDPSKAGVSSRNIAVLKDDGKHLCIACNDVYGFLDSPKESVLSKETILSKESIKTKSIIKKNTYTCSNQTCKKHYEGRICPHCNTPNVLFSRKIKKRKNKK